MDFASPEFTIFVLIALFFHRWLAPTRLASWAFAIINLAFIARHARGILDMIPLLGFAGIGYIAHCVSLKSGSVLGRVWPALPAVMIGLFIYFKQYSICTFLPPVHFDGLTLGMSFILFRTIQIMIDSRDGGIRTRISLVNYFNFTCSFITFVSGPIQRYQDFAEQTETQKNPIALDVIIAGLSRIVCGYLKIMLWSALAWQAHDQSLVFWRGSEPGLAAIAGYAAACGAYLLFLFFNFSGYTDIVIGIGRWFGWHLPENFLHPFACTNFLDLWARWHMTLSIWFKWYLYNPFLKLLVSRISTPKALPYLGCLAYFATFFVMGVWHGSTLDFLTYGFILGSGVSVNKLYQVVTRKALGKRRHEMLVAEPAHYHLSRGLALAYFAVSLTCFWIKPHTNDLLQQQGLVQMTASALATLAIVGAMASAMWSLLVHLAAPLITIMTPADAKDSSALGFWWLLLRMALLVVVIIILHGSTPDFVYKAF